MLGTHAPHPVDQLELLVQIHHEDAEEDHGEDHLADGHGRVASIQGRRVADDDDEANELWGLGQGRPHSSVVSSAIL